MFSVNKFTNELNSVEKTKIVTGMLSTTHSHTHMHQHNIHTHANVNKKALIKTTTSPPFRLQGRG